MSRIAIVPILFFSCCFSLCLREEVTWRGKSVDFSHGNLRVSPNGRFLMHADGTPFFYLGDTVRELFHRLVENEVEYYLEDRRTKGFTVIQAVILAELDGLNTPNRNGNKPLIDNDPEKPNKAYFRCVDTVLKMAESKGLYIALLPTWGDKVDKQWGVGPMIFNEENIAVYGKYLAGRYRNFPNIIWINGGDRKGGDANFAVWDALGKAIKSIDKNHLMTYHPSGETSSSQWFHDCSWLDYNIQAYRHSRIVQQSRRHFKTFAISEWRTGYQFQCTGQHQQCNHLYNKSLVGKGITKMKLLYVGAANFGSSLT